jgi:hypothetical protein
LRNHCRPSSISGTKTSSSVSWMFWDGTGWVEVEDEADGVAEEVDVELGVDVGGRRHQDFSWW